MHDHADPALPGLLREFDEVVFSAPVNVVQGPVKTQFGYHIMRLISRSEGPAMNEERFDAQTTCVMVLKAEAPPLFRVYGELIPLEAEPLSRPPSRPRWTCPGTSARTCARATTWR